MPRTALCAAAALVLIAAPLAAHAEDAAPPAEKPAAAETPPVTTPAEPVAVTVKRAPWTAKKPNGKDAGQKGEAPAGKTSDASK